MASLLDTGRCGSSSLSSKDENYAGTYAFFRRQENHRGKANQEFALAQDQEYEPIVACLIRRDASQGLAESLSKWRHVDPLSMRLYSHRFSTRCEASAGL
ncbi:MAG: hypothetical protein J0H40_23145 [Rhizobiales bacterium]|nr:hypothetical protein [Hyphomicrobiales bacterium]